MNVTKKRVKKFVDLLNYKICSHLFLACIIAEK